MICLGIDTSGETLNVGIYVDGAILGERTSAGESPHSVMILPEIEALCREAAVAPSRVTLIAVTGGPGRYTALRVGMATAKGLALAWGVPMTRVSALEAMAVSLSLAEGTLVPVLDARRRLVYTAVFEVRDNRIRRIEADQALPYEAAAFRVPDGTILTGDGVSLIEPFLREAGIGYETRTGVIRGGVVAKLGAEAFGASGADELLEGPTYIRKVETHGHGFHVNP